MFSAQPPPSPTVGTFQTYILPSVPFRRRQSSVVSPTSPSPNAVFSPSSPITPNTPGTSLSGTPLSFHNHDGSRPQHGRRLSYLQGHTSHISCLRCKASLALSSQIISKGFTGRHGRAYLVSPSAIDTSPVPPTTQQSSRSGRTSRAYSTASSLGSGSKTGSNVMRTRTQSTAADGTRPPAGPRRRSSALSVAFNAALGTISPSSTTSAAPQLPEQTPPSQPWYTRFTPTSPLSTISSTFSSRSASQHTNATTPSSASSFPPPQTDLPNTTTHKPVQRHLVTGLHTVSDVSCAHCGSVIGWKYIAAEEETQRYKIGKYILETKRVVVGSEWEGVGEVFDFESDDEEELGEHDYRATEAGTTPAIRSAGVMDKGRGCQETSSAYALAGRETSTDGDTTRPAARVRSMSIRWSDPPAPASTAAAAQTRINSTSALHSPPSTTVTTTQASAQRPAPSTSTVTEPTSSSSSSPSPRPSRRASELNRDDLAFLNLPQRADREPQHDAGLTSDGDEEDKDEDDEYDDEDGEVLFDSQDEDECDELFAGIWNAEVVKTRRDSRRLSQVGVGR